MNHFNNYLKTSAHLIEDYNGVPFAVYLKNFFSKNRKYGKRDRKQISSLCYYYFRVAKACPDINISEKIIRGAFLCENTPSEFLEVVAPSLNKFIAEPVELKLKLLKNECNTKQLFPFGETLSEGINLEEYSLSFLTQPDLFLRIRPEKKNEVVKKINDPKFPGKLVGESCISLPNSTKAEELFILDDEVVVQDLNSQKVFDYLKSSANLNLPVTVWDCCAASGGKSILIADILQHKINLIVSDIRPGILSNLQQRFKQANIQSYRHFIADLCNKNFEKNIPTEILAKLDPDIIICDVPCTGSGTWSRTPEQLYLFDQKSIAGYADKQKKIVQHVIPFLKKGGLLFYITCSVFKDENEGACDYIEQHLSLHKLSSKILKGYSQKADTMFVAVFRK